MSSSFFVKEDIHANNTDKLLFLLAPSVFLAPIIGAFAILPFSPYLELPGTALATGIVYYVAMSSIDVIGVIMTGWGSNNKYALMGGLRCGLVETNRAPFDLPEAESELVAGYLTEYSGVRWAMFFLGEYGNMVIVSAIASYLFLGGWDGPGVAYLIGLGTPVWGFVGNALAFIYFVIKVYGICFVFMWVRATLPRLRADQLMQFAWLILIPITLINIVVTGMLYLLANGLGLPIWVFLVILGAVNWAACFAFIRLVQRVTTATTRLAQAPAIRAQHLARAVPALQAPGDRGV